MSNDKKIEYPDAKHPDYKLYTEALKQVEKLYGESYTPEKQKEVALNLTIHAKRFDMDSIDQISGMRGGMRLSGSEGGEKIQTTLVKSEMSLSAADAVQKLNQMNQWPELGKEDKTTKHEYPTPGHPKFELYSSALEALQQVQPEGANSERQKHDALVIATVAGNAGMKNVEEVTANQKGGYRIASGDMMNSTDKSATVTPFDLRQPVKEMMEANKPMKVSSLLPEGHHDQGLYQQAVKELGRIGAPYNDPATQGLEVAKFIKEAKPEQPKPALEMLNEGRPGLLVATLGKGPASENIPIPTEQIFNKNPQETLQAMNYFNTQRNLMSQNANLSETKSERIEQKPLSM
jgi:hypothetical protein